jgi:fatty acid desaturase
MSSACVIWNDAKQGPTPSERPRQEATVLWTIAMILLILWLLGYVTFHAFGIYIHILLILAIIAILVRIIQGRNAL